MKNKLILIGSVNQFIDNEGNSLQYGAKVFKYLMIEEDGELKMLLMVEDEPFEFHAEALLKYMEDNKISEIKVNGGGKFMNMFYEDRSEMHFFDRSFSFGDVYPEEVKFFTEMIWPSFKIDIKSLPVFEDMGNIFEKGKVFTINEVRHKAETS